MSEAAETADARKPGGAGEFWESVKTVVSVLLIVLVFRTLLFQPFTIPSASMEPNLYEGDYIVVSKFSYGWSHHSILFSPPLFHGRIMERTPKRGDIIVFKSPGDIRHDYIKRLIGLPGDRIQMKDGLLYLNGKLIPRQAGPVVREEDKYGGPHMVSRFTETLPTGKSYLTNDFGRDGGLDNTKEYQVPAGHYFMMGDNRDNSLDSRVPAAEGGVDFVPAENLVGKAQIILFSWSPGASLFKPWTWVLNLRFSRFFHILR